MPESIDGNKATDSHACFQPVDFNSFCPFARPNSLHRNYAPFFILCFANIYTASSCRTAKYLDEFSSERVCLNYRAKYILSIWDIFELILDTTLLFFFIFALINGQE